MRLGCWVWVPAFQAFPDSPEESGGESSWPRGPLPRGEHSWHAGDKEWRDGDLWGCALGWASGGGGCVCLVGMFPAPSLCRDTQTEARGPWVPWAPAATASWSRTGLWARAGHHSRHSGMCGGLCSQPVLLSKGRAGRDGQGAACSPAVSAFSPPAPRGGLGRCGRRAVLAAPCTRGAIRFHVCDRALLVPISKLKTRGTQEGEETLGGASAGPSQRPLSLGSPCRWRAGRPAPRVLPDPAARHGA